MQKRDKTDNSAEVENSFFPLTTTDPSSSLKRERDIKSGKMSAQSCKNTLNRSSEEFSTNVSSHRMLKFIAV